MASVALTVNNAFKELVGVPDNTPDELNVNPVGSVPETNEYVGFVPESSVATSVVEYDMFLVNVAIGDVVDHTGANSVIVIENDLDTELYPSEAVILKEEVTSPETEEAVPEITPVDVFNDNPPGKDPLDTE